MKSDHCGSSPSIKMGCFVFETGKMEVVFFDIFFFTLDLIPCKKKQERNKKEG